MTNELREELEQHYNRAAAAAAEQESKQQPSETKEGGNIDDEYLIAPRSYKKEYSEIFKTLPPAMRKYLHERESETEKGFSRLHNELNNHRWIDDVFASRSARLERLGISKAKDWVETMARIDDALDTDPSGTLQTLAEIYGIQQGQPLSTSMDVSPLLERLEALDGKFSRFADDYRARLADEQHIAESKKAKEASFAPKGKNPVKDLSKLSTREVLELKLAEYDD